MSDTVTVYYAVQGGDNCYVRVYNPSMCRTMQVKATKHGVLSILNKSRKIVQNNELKGRYQTKLSEQREYDSLAGNNFLTRNPTPLVLIKYRKICVNLPSGSFFSTLMTSPS